MKDIFKKSYKYVKYLITFIIVILFILYFVKNKDEFLEVLKISPLYLLTLIFLYSIAFFLNGLFIKVILRRFDKNISSGESLYVSVISSLGNYFLPMRGGAVLRSVYLKKKFNFSYSYFVSTLYGNYIIIFLVNSFIAIISLVFIHIEFGKSSLPLYIFFITLFIVMISLSLIKVQIHVTIKYGSKIINKIKNILYKILTGWNLIIEDKRLLIELILITVLSFFITTIIVIVEYLSLGIPINVVNVIFYNCLSSVSLLISITPGSLGIREGLFMITSDVIGISSNEVMQLALLDRGVTFISLVLLFLFSYLTIYYINLRNKKNANLKLDR